MGHKTYQRILTCKQCDNTPEDGEPLWDMCNGWYCEDCVDNIEDEVEDEEILSLTQQNEDLLQQRKRISKSAHFHIGKLLKHNEVSSHDREMMRQLLEKIDRGVNNE